MITLYIASAILLVLGFLLFRTNLARCAALVRQRAALVRIRLVRLL